MTLLLPMLLVLGSPSRPPAALAQGARPYNPGLAPQRCLTVEASVLLAWRRADFRVTPRDAAPGADELIESAREYLGMPYVWGSTGPDSFDCSGFVNRVYAGYGYDLPRTSREIFKVGMVVPREQLQAGDLLFFVSQPGQERITHVGMYVADAEMIHAAMGKGEVTYDRLTSRYYAARFSGARRYLSLRPGTFSSKVGLARPAALYEYSDKGPGRKVATAAPADAADVSGSVEGGEDAVTEHVGDTPVFLSPSFVKGAITQVGPRAMLTDATSVGLRIGGASVSDRGSVLFVPEVTYFGHDNALRVGLAGPIQVPLGGDQSTGELAAAQWSDPRDFARVIREVTWGQKEAPLYVDLSRTASGSLGHGALMRYYTPNIADAALPHYVLSPNALSLSADGFLPWGGAELFVGDVFAADVMGGLVFARPFKLLGAESALAQSISLAASYAVDPEAPYTLSSADERETRAVHGVGLDVEVKPLKTDAVDLKVYADGSSLLYPDGSSVGGALGTLLRANLSGSRVHVLRVRGELRLSQASFIPSYFDATYALNRHVAPVDEPGAVPLTKLELLRALEGTANRWGYYGELSYQYARRGSFGLSYEDSDVIGDLPRSEDYSGRSVMLFAELRNIYLPRSSKFLSFYLSYHLRNFDTLTPVFGLDRSNEQLFFAGSFTVNPQDPTHLGAMG